MTNHSDLPLHDFENDKRVSDARKSACRKDYLEMSLEDLDKIFTSAFVYDKKTNKPVAKKPKSVHELLFYLLKSAQATSAEVDSLKDELNALKTKNAA